MAKVGIRLEAALAPEVARLAAVGAVAEIDDEVAVVVDEELLDTEDGPVLGRTV